MMRRPAPPAISMSQVGGSGMVVTVAEKVSDQFIAFWKWAEARTEPRLSVEPTANVPVVRSSGAKL